MGLKSEPLFVTVMISCEQRHHVRQTTISLLEPYGIHPRVTTSTECVGGPTQRATAQAALQDGVTTARETNQGHILFLEDDVTPSEFVRAGTDRAIEEHPGAVTYLYVTDTRGARGELVYGPNRWHMIKRTREEIMEEFVLVDGRGRSGLLGSQAVLMPVRAAELAIRVMMNPPRPGFASDSSFVAAWRRYKIETRVRIPHVFQHRHDRTARTSEAGINKKSLSFGRGS